MEPRKPEKKRRRAPEHPLKTDEQRRARLHEKNKRDGELEVRRNREKQD